MRVLFTGVTSFSGMWFVRKLAERGHDVVAVARGEEDSYSGLKADRLKLAAGQCEIVWNTPFGSPAFMETIRGRFDVLCHHGADTTNYKSPDFDILGATARNTQSLCDVLKKLCAAGCRRIVLTGSVFEANEGAGSAPMRAFSGYGLSKTLTGEIFQFFARQEGMSLGQFVIANPFGPYEEPRFTDYLMRCWKAGKPARVNTPAYVRDNIHVSLLAACYAQFVSDMPDTGRSKLNPSFYVETQGAFARRFADEMGARLAISPELELADQTDFEEPQVRINTDLVRGASFGWDERAAWDDLAGYYARRFELNLNREL
jgi:UDP-glucose 4-epimerase